MKKTILALTLLTSLAAFACGQVDVKTLEKQADSAGNLFSKSGVKNPFEDRIARKEGDILTVLISEVSSSNFTASTNLSKTDSNSMSNGIPILQGLLKGLSTSASSSNAGSGATTNTGKLSAQMAVMVKEVLPNGNLVVEGSRYIKTNKNVQLFKITGIVRSDDVTSANTVLSQNISGFNISVTGTGSINDRQRRGIITRIVDWLF